MLNIKNLQKMIDEHYISVQKHPASDLYIYNYTQKTHFHGMWNNETRQCRGLILDKQYTIIQRPFPKFFNLQEAILQGEHVPDEQFLVTEKLDGSLGILYRDADSLKLATRGSFMSDQAKKGTQLVQKYTHVPFSPDFTYLFEIIYPENKIVVDYGKKEDIILLGAIEKQSGREMSYEQLQAFAAEYMISLVKKYDAITDFSRLQTEPNKEGYVLTFPLSNQRFKIKFDEYVRLHRLITGVNTRVIWDLLKNRQTFDELLERVPEEFYIWVRQTKKGLEEEYTQIEQLCLSIKSKLQVVPTRKDQARMVLKDHKAYAGIIFALLDNKPYQEIIWKMLKPKAEKPFRQEM